jgi:ribose/xylose/arabinose/galactoside ABC-type transport system permease subunit
MSATRAASSATVSPRHLLIGHINEFGLLAIVVILYVVFGVVSPGFLSVNNQVNILRDGATIGIAAWAQTLVIVAGEIDISVGPMVAFIAVVMAFFMKWDLPLPVTIAAGLVLGGALGGLAGILRAVFSVPSFVATLGLWSALRGLAMFMTNALPISFDDNDTLDWIGDDFFGIPVSAIVMIVLFVVFVA